MWMIYYSFIYKGQSFSKITTSFKVKCENEEKELYITLDCFRSDRKNVLNQSYSLNKTFLKAIFVVNYKYIKNPVKIRLVSNFYRAV